MSGLWRPATEEKIVVRVQSFFREMTDAAWFLMAIIRLEVLEALRTNTVLPAWVLPF